MKFFFNYLSINVILTAVFLSVCVAPLRAEIDIGSVVLPDNREPQQLEAFLETVYQQSLDNGFSNYRSYALLLVRESRDALGKKDYRQAAVLTEYAQKFSPDLPAVYAARAQVQWYRNKLFIHHLPVGTLEAWAPIIKDLDAMSFMVVVNLFVITGACLLMLAVFAVIAMIKCFPLAYHDLRHLIPASVPDKAFSGLVGIVFFLPLLLGCSIFVLFGYWLVLLFSYHVLRDRLVITGLLVIPVFLPLVFFAVNYCLFLPRSEVVRLLWDAGHGSWERRSTERLEACSLNSPDDPDILFSLGLVHKKEQRYRTAQHYYEKLLAFNPRHAKARTNLGNVYLALGKWQEAVEQYREVISSAPLRSAAAHFNLSRAYQQKFMFDEAESEFLQSKKNDARLIDRYVRIYSENYNRLLIDETISRRDLWHKGYELFLKDAEQPAGLLNLFAAGPPRHYVSAFFVVMIIMSWCLFRKDNFRIAIPCKVCGKPICKRCQINVRADTSCMQCRNYFQKKDKIDHRLRDEKLSRIQRYRSTRVNIETLLVLFCPGAGHIWKGHSIKGTGYLFVYFVVLLKLTALIVFEAPWEIPVSMAFFEVGGCVLLLVVLWPWLVRNGRKCKSPELDDVLLSK